jgi:Tfp pilus assembly protein PilE
MIVVGIVALLVSLAAVSYSHFMHKAKAVEAELVVHEIERLQHLYHAVHHTYSDNLDELGFSISGKLKYYEPEVRVGLATTGINYQVRAVPVNASSNNAWLLTSFREGPLRVDRMPGSFVVIFASARYAGMSNPTLTSSEATDFLSGTNGVTNLESEWSGGSGNSSRCRECGRTVVNQRSNTGGGLK